MRLGISAWVFLINLVKILFLKGSKLIETNQLFLQKTQGFGQGFAKTKKLRTWQLEKNNPTSHLSYNKGKISAFFPHQRFKKQFSTRDITQSCQKVFSTFCS